MHVSSFSVQCDDSEQVGELFPVGHFLFLSLWVTKTSGDWLFLFSRKWEQLSADLDWQWRAATVCATRHQKQCTSSGHVNTAGPSQTSRTQQKQKIFLIAHPILLVMSHFVDIVRKYSIFFSDCKQGIHPHFPLRVRLKLQRCVKTPFHSSGCAGWGWGVSVSGSLLMNHRHVFSSVARVCVWCGKLLLSCLFLRRSWDRLEHVPHTCSCKLIGFKRHANFRHSNILCSK